ncbi:MAG: hypothetical protein ACRDZO_05295 [Egibacteraceae bacterium]
MSTMIVTDPKNRVERAEPSVLTCAEWTDESGARCGLPVQVVRSDMLGSTEGQVEHVHTRCAAGHWLNCPVEVFV